MVSLWPGRRARLERRAAVSSRILSATDAGRDILVNTPSGWEVEQPWLWWISPPGSTPGDPPIWGNPPPGASGDGGALSTSLPAVTRCTSIICSTIAGLPWVPIRGEYERLDVPRWISDPQMTRLDGRTAGAALDFVRLSAVEFWTDWVRAALWTGDGYVYVPQRDASGVPVPPLWQLNPAFVEITDEGEPGIFRYVVNGVDVPEESILHLRGEPPYEMGHGNGVLNRHGVDLGLAMAVRLYAAGQYATGIPAGYLKSNAPNMDQTKADDLKAKWLAQHGGAARSIAVLNATTEFVPIAVSPLDAQLDTARQWSMRDIALAFGVPAYMLGVPGDPSTYANVESRMIELSRFTLLPWVRRIESTLDAEFPLGTSLRVVMSAIERADTKTRYDSYASALGAKWLTVDEVRALEDLPPLPPEPAPAPTPPTPPPPDVTAPPPDATAAPATTPPAPLGGVAA